MSPLGRAMPRWSAAGQVALLAVLMRRAAGQQRVGFGRAAVVGQRPKQRVDRAGARADLVVVDAIGDAAGPVPSPIRLNELAATTAPLISSRTEAVELKLPATIVLRSVTAACSAQSRRPRQLPLLSLSAVLLLMVTLVKVALPVPPPG